MIMRTGTYGQAIVIGIAPFRTWQCDPGILRRQRTLVSPMRGTTGYRQGRRTIPAPLASPSLCRCISLASRARLRPDCLPQPPQWSRRPRVGELEMRQVVRCAVTIGGTIRPADVFCAVLVSCESRLATGCLPCAAAGLVGDHNADVVVVGEVHGYPFI